MGSGGKRVGARRKRTFQPFLLLLTLGVTLAVVAWGYLVKAAIDFGASARGGRTEAWWFLGLASLGAVACLFVGLIMVSRILRRLGLTRSDDVPRPRSGGTGSSEPTTPTVRIPGGRRAAR